MSAPATKGELARAPVMMMTLTWRWRQLVDGRVQVVDSRGVLNGIGRRVVDGQDGDAVFDRYLDVNVGCITAHVKILSLLETGVCALDACKLRDLAGQSS